MTNILAQITIDLKSDSPFQAKCELILGLQKLAYTLSAGPLVSGRDGVVHWSIATQEGGIL